MNFKNAIGYFDSAANGLNGGNGNQTLGGTLVAPVANPFSTPLTEDGQRAWHAGGKYNFGVAAVSLEFANYRNPFFESNFNTDFWDIGASVPVGPAAIFYFNYLHKKDKNFSSNNSNLYKFAIDYNMSKTFTAYANLGFTNNSSTGTMGVMNSGNTFAGQNQAALGVGLRKAF